MSQYRLAFGRPPAVAARAMVATSTPVSTRAGLRVLERGGNAVDAAIAAAAAIAVTEPTSNGVGSDCFALVWRDGVVTGLDSAGPAPRTADPVEPVAGDGPRSVTVPGAVGGWAALAERFGTLGLDALLADAIDAAERGYAVTPRTAEAWGRGRRVPAEYLPAPKVGEVVRLPELAATLRRIAAEGPRGFYEGEVARAICSVTWLEEEDLAAFRAQFVEPLRYRYRGVDVLELPPPTQGVVALEALGLYERMEHGLAARVRATALALEDGLARVRDGADVSELVSARYLDRRAAADRRPVSGPGGGTVYLCVVDEERTAVSFIQSNYEGFGSGLVAPGTGVALQNRGACFAVAGRVDPGRRPYHTIIPGLLARDGALLGPFGVMGGFLQAQAHMQLVCGLVDDGLDPQAALDAPRFRIEGEHVLLEEGLWQEQEALRRAGIDAMRDEESFGFGGGQAILVEGDALVGGTDPRKDGYAAGL